MLSGNGMPTQFLLPYYVNTSSMLAGGSVCYRSTSLTLLPGDPRTAVDRQLAVSCRHRALRLPSSNSIVSQQLLQCAILCLLSHGRPSHLRHRVVHESRSQLKIAKTTQCATEVVVLQSDDGP